MSIYKSMAGIVSALIAMYLLTSAVRAVEPAAKWSAAPADEAHHETSAPGCEHSKNGRVTYKILFFAKRRSDLTRAEFISLYEKTHIQLTNQLVNSGKLPRLLDYRRNYIVPDSEFNIGGPLDFDVVTEAIYADKAAFQASRAATAQPEVAKLVGENLATFLDMKSMRYIVVDECRGGGGSPD